MHSNRIALCGLRRAKSARDRSPQPNALDAALARLKQRNTVTTTNRRSSK